MSRRGCASWTRALADGTILALAGLKRLGLRARRHRPDAAGKISAGARTGRDLHRKPDRRQPGRRDWSRRSMISPTGQALACERAFLAALDGSCRTPIAGHASGRGRALSFNGLILSPDGRESHEIACEGRAEDAAAIGRKAGEQAAGKGRDAILRRLGLNAPRAGDAAGARRLANRAPAGSARLCAVPAAAIGNACLAVDCASIPDDDRRGRGDQRQCDPPCAARTRRERLRQRPASRSAKRPPRRRGPPAFCSVIEGPGDAEGLARTIIASRSGRSRCSIFAGACAVRPSRNVLAAAGIAVTPIETYDTVTGRPRARRGNFGPWRPAGRCGATLFRQGRGGAVGTAGPAGTSPTV